MDTIKCGRETYELKQGDTVLDNGHCLQLTSRSVRRGWHSYPPRVSKAAFKKFQKLTNIEINQDGGLTYYVYR